MSRPKGERDVETEDYAEAREVLMEKANTAEIMSRWDDRAATHGASLRARAERFRRAAFTLARLEEPDVPEGEEETAADVGESIADWLEIEGWVSTHTHSWAGFVDAMRKMVADLRLSPLISAVPEPEEGESMLPADTSRGEEVDDGRSESGPTAEGEAGALREGEGAGEGADLPGVRAGERDEGGPSSVASGEGVPVLRMGDGSHVGRARAAIQRARDLKESGLSGTDVEWAIIEAIEEWESPAETGAIGAGPLSKALRENDDGLLQSRAPTATREPNEREDGMERFITPEPPINLKHVSPQDGEREDGACSIWGDIGRLQYLIGYGTTERALAVLGLIEADLRIRLTSSPSEPRGETDNGADGGGALEALAREMEEEASDQRMKSEEQEFEEKTKHAYAARLLEAFADSARRALARPESREGAE